MCGKDHGTHHVMSGSGETDNNRMELPAPLGARAVYGSMDAAASCPPFGGHRRRSSSVCSADLLEGNER